MTTNSIQSKVVRQTNSIRSIAITLALSLLLSSLCLNHQPAMAQTNASRNISSTTNSSTVTATKPQIQWNVYANKKFGFSVEYPHGWQIQEKQNRFIEGPALKIESNTSMLDQNHGSFDFVPISGTFSDVSELTLVGIQQLVNNFEVDYDKRLIEAPDMNKYKIGGENAGAFTYILKKKNYLDDSSPNYLGTATEIVNTIHNGKAFLFQFLASGENFDNPMLSEIRQHMFNSIKWLK